MKDKKKTLLIIGIIAVLLIDAALAFYFYQKSLVKPEIPETVTVDESTDKLGLRKDETSPELILQNDSNTLYVGNKSYDFEPLAYDNYGEVEITYDDSLVNYNKAGNYEIKVIATDAAGNSTAKMASLTLKEKPKPVVTYTNTASSGSSSGSGSSGSSSASDSSSSSGGTGGGSAMYAFDGYACGPGARAFLGIDDYTWYTGYQELGYTTDLQYGDVCFWNWGGRYPEGHAIVYIGNGQMFEANYDGHYHARTAPMRYDYDYVLRYGS